MNKCGEKYEQTVLIKLRRNYGKDETVLWAFNKIQELTEANKSLRQELANAKNDLNQALSLRSVKITEELWQKVKNEVIHEIALTTEQKKEIKENAVITQLKEKNSNLSRRNKELEKSNKELIYKNLQLQK